MAAAQGTTSGEVPPILRIQTYGLALNVNGQDYAANTKEYILNPNDFSSPMLVCVNNVGPNSEYEAENVAQCDNTQNIDTFTGSLDGGFMSVCLCLFCVCFCYPVKLF